MIYVPLHESTPPEKWLLRANSVLQELEDACSQEERHAIIDRHGRLWRGLKRWLLKLSYKKCWFSETKAEYSHFHVEHFRPKKKALELDGTSRDGYWWLAFDWSNLRVCGGVGNAKKGTYFPLRQGTTPASSGNRRIDREVPLLLDPTRPEDVTLLTFEDTGKASPQADIGNWSTLRVTETIRLLDLNYEDLKEARRAKWAECHRKLEQFESYAQEHDEFGDPGMLKAMRDVRNEIYALIDPAAPLSATAVTCLLKRGGWAARLINEAPRRPRT